VRISKCYRKHKESFDNNEIKVASVTGGFPSSQTFLEIKTQEHACVYKGVQMRWIWFISIGEF
jgi:hypothetical protein